MNPPLPWLTAGVSGLVMGYAEIAAAADAMGLHARGGFALNLDDRVPPLPDGAPARAVVLLGNVGGALWRAFSAAAEFGDGAADPLDRWSRRRIEALAEQFAVGAVFPFGPPPHQPFIAWAKRAEAVANSPLGMLIHPRHGLWHAYRGALVLARVPADLPARGDDACPCDSCVDRPCLVACPVGAFDDGVYRVDDCTAHIAVPAGADCLEGGCLARRACPVGAADDYAPAAQHALHMQAFLTAQRRPGAA